eukprot:scaffold86_cov338-Pavlova_lutheri.AAC.7
MDMPRLPFASLVLWQRENNLQVVSNTLFFSKPIRRCCCVWRKMGGVATMEYPCNRNRRPTQTCRYHQFLLHSFSPVPSAR